MNTRLRFVLSQYKEYQIFKNITTRKQSGKKYIFFVGIGYMYISRFEILLYHLLKLRGAETLYLVYGPDVPIHEHMTKSVLSRESSVNFQKRSAKKTFRLLRRCKVEYQIINYSDELLGKLGLQEPNSLIELYNFNYKGVAFGNIIKGSLYRHFKSLTFDDTALEIGINHLKVALSNYIEIERRLSSSDINAVLMSHGIYTTWEPVVEACKQHNVNFVCYDRAKTENCINININQASPDWDFSSAWVRFAHKELTESENQLTDKYLSDRILQKGDVYSYNFSLKEQKDHLKKRLKIPENRKIVTIFTNLIWDAANVSRDIAFSSPLSCIIETLKYFEKRSDVQIVLRVHPAEKVLGTKEKYGTLVRDYFKQKLPENITIIEPEDDVNSFSVIDISDIGVVNTSTVGLEFALIGKPVLLISETNYRGKGFTYDANSSIEYFTILEKLLDRPMLKENQISLARKYFFMMMFLYQKRVPIIFRNGIFSGYASNTLESLSKNRVMSSIVDKIFDIDAHADFIEWDYE